MTHFDSLILQWLNAIELGLTDKANYLFQRVVDQYNILREAGLIQ